MNYKHLRDALEYCMKANPKAGKIALYTLAYGGQVNLVVDYRCSMSYAIRVLKDRVSR